MMGKKLHVPLEQVQEMRVEKLHAPPEQVEEMFLMDKLKEESDGRREGVETGKCVKPRIEFPMNTLIVIYSSHKISE